MLRTGKLLAMRCCASSKRLARALGTDRQSGGISSHDFAALIARMTRPESLSSLASRLFDLVAAPLAFGRLNLRLRPSIGVAASPADSMSVRASLRCSNSAPHRMQDA